MSYILLEILDIILTLLTMYSLLVAIGIEAFNKFSEEQKAESEEEEEEEDVPSGDVPEGEKKSKTHFFSILNIKSYCKKIAGWTKAATSSTRV